LSGASIICGSTSEIGDAANRWLEQVEEPARLEQRAFGPAFADHLFLDVLAGHRFEGVGRADLGCGLVALAGQ